MKSMASMLLAGALAVAGLAPARAAAAVGQASPIEKVLQLLTDQEQRVSSEHAEAKRIYEEASKWCVQRSEELKFQIKTGEANIKDLEATIAEETALIASLNTKVEELSGTISTQDSDLKAATQVHETEVADFLASEKELTEAIDTLMRAVTILEREMRKGGASMVQLKTAGNLAQVFGLMVDASMITAKDATQLTALVQSTQGSEDQDLELSASAPQAAAYESKSGSIVNTLKDLADKAESQLEDLRKQATQNNHNYEMLKQSLEDHIRLASKELEEAKTSIAKSSEKKGRAEGDLAATTSNLREDKESLEMLHQDCLTKAQDFEAESKSREDELKALGEAKKIIAESTSGAAENTYGLAQVSLLQLRRASSSDDAGMRVVRLIRRMARKDGSKPLALLASHIATTVNSDSTNDPFAKVKGLISDMIQKLESEADADASLKAYCDKELKETHSKESSKQNTHNKLTTQIEQMSARSAQLKDEIAALQSGLAALASSQAEMDKLRQEEKDLFVKSKADLEQGLAGIKKALQVLRDFYGNADAATGGAGSGIIGLLEVVESDFSKGLTETIAAEEKAVASYKESSKQNQLEKASKEKDVEYKGKESAELDKAAADATSDSKTVEAELNAIEEYLAKLNEQCVGKAETFEERAARRQAEIAGLKEALNILSDDGAALLQQSARRSLRGVKPHA